MNKGKPLVVLLLLLFLFNSCVEPFNPKAKKGEERIIVEGWLIDKLGPYQIRLSKTSNYSYGYEGVNFGVKGAKVFITDDLGNTAEYKEYKYGTYQTEKEAITRTVGRTYQLTIQVGEKVYQSKPQKMRAVPPIDSLYYLYKDENDFREQGFYIYANIRDPVEEKNYYWWQWEGHTPLKICRNPTPEDPHSYICCNPCWRIIRDSTVLYFNSDKGVNGNYLKDEEVARIPYSTRMAIDVRVIQYSLSEEAYNFFSQVKLLNKSSGSVFNVAPFPVQGNLINVNDKEDALLGHFTIAARKWKWVYVDRSNIDKLPTGPLESSPTSTGQGCAPCVEDNVTTVRIPGSY